RVAVVGGGIGGLTAARVLKDAGVDVVIYEREEWAPTFTVDGTRIDIGFLNPVTYSNMVELFESLGLEAELSDVSFSVSLDNGRGYEWGIRNGLSSLFAQKKNVFNPYYWTMLREIRKFSGDVISYLQVIGENADVDRNETLGHFIQSRGYSEMFQKAYLIPICVSIWGCSSEDVMIFAASSVLSFFRDQHLLQIFDYHQQLTINWSSDHFVSRIVESLESRGCEIRTNSEVCCVSSNEEGCTVICENGSEDKYDHCIITAHAPDAIKMLGNQLTFDEMRILGAFQYACSDIYLHRDKTLMPKSEAAWSAYNFLGSLNDGACVTIWLNVLQNLDQGGLPFLVTLNPPYGPEHKLLKWTSKHPIPSVAASIAYSQSNLIQGKRRIWFGAAYQGYGFDDDGLKAGFLAANDLLRRSSTDLINSRHLVPSMMDMGARLLVTQFLSRFIATGTLILLEDGGTVLSFKGALDKCPLKVTVRIHSLQFYWKVATEADIGLGQAYMDGDFSLVDKNEGLLNFLTILIINRDLDSSILAYSHRGWWTPLISTALVSTAKYYFRHALRRNTIAHARQNISAHYDLSNELFSLFLDERMQYSCPVFKVEGEDLNSAQLRKIHLLIEKSRVCASHHVLELGCGWGGLGIELVKRTGCRYTGVTLSKQQQKYAEAKANEAGLQDRATFILGDYREVPKTRKYDRIISCEMLESIGVEYTKEFFSICESLLVEDGLLVVQFTTVPDSRFENNRRTSGFISEYIFQGSCIPSLSYVTSAMGAASRFWVEHLEDIGVHYYPALRCWRDNFLRNRNQIEALGFDDKFVRMFEYYFDYCASAFKTCAIGNYQLVLSRPGNVAIFGDPY
ncbi:hypothetical protein M569_04599, partial [Genlisea aurea]